MGYDSQPTRGVTLSDSWGALCISTRALATTNNKGILGAPKARLLYRSYKGLRHIVNNDKSEAIDQWRCDWG